MTMLRAVVVKGRSRTAHFRKRGSPPTSNAGTAFQVSAARSKDRTRPGETGQDRHRTRRVWDQTRTQRASEDGGLGGERTVYLEIPCTGQQDNEGDESRGGWGEGREERV